MRQDKIEEYDVLRVITTFLVIIGHCAYITISTNWGGIDYNNTFSLENTAIFVKSAQLITKVIYKFHMPLFIALSGALFYYTLQKNNLTFWYLVQSKGKRLIVPFIAVSVCYVFPLKYLAGYYSSSENIVESFLMGQILVQGNTYLWYLLTLFCIFILFYFGRKLVCNNPVISWILLLTLYELSEKAVSIQLLQYIFQYSIWFAVGFYFEKKRKAINFKINMSSLATIILSFMAAFIIDTYILCTPSDIFFKLILRCIKLYEVFSGMFAIYSISYLISKTNIQQKKCFKQLAEDSFGLYLYSDSWNYLILMWGYSLVGNRLFTSNGCFAALYIARFLGTTIIALAVTHLIRKIRSKLRSLRSLRYGA